MPSFGDDFPPLAARRPDTPPDLDPLLRRCMHKDANGRLGSVREMLDALRAIQTARPSQPAIGDMKGTVKMSPPSPQSWSNQPISAPTTNPRGATPSVRGTLPMNAFPGAPELPKRTAPSRAFYWMIILGFLFAAAAIAAFAVYLTR